MSTAALLTPHRSSTALAPLRTAGLTKSYSGFVALKPLDLEIEAGSIVGYLGPNGAGKSTTMNLLMGYIRPTAGTATILGHPAGSAAARADLAYVPSHSGFWGHLTGRETLHFLAQLSGGDDLARRHQLIDAFDFDPDKKVRTYSTGNRQKLAIIAALSRHPRLLLCDEASTGLDPLVEKVFQDELLALRDEGAAILLSSHTLGEVDAICNRILIINQGRIVDDGAIDELKHLHSHRLTVHFAGPAPEIAPVPGVSLTERRERELVFTVEGEQTELFRALRDQPITAVETREPTLEEIFLSRYQTEPSDAGQLESQDRP
ncbi:MAG: ABC transporter ATP-binding protein [Propionibacteriaceae bacterium]|jgi:ABC-2 type transport system ATP-binding protein|nr:ABC transporter ATP-binding protein [Propionibacteriaceae bacterium]